MKHTPVEIAEDQKRDCRDCGHYGYCQWLIGAKDDWKECDWTPTRWVLKPEGGIIRI